MPRANPQRDESVGKHLFIGAVFNITFNTAKADSAAVHATVLQKRFKRILPLVDGDDDHKELLSFCLIGTGFVTIS